MKSSAVWTFAIAVFVMLSGCGSEQKPASESDGSSAIQLTISAAASLTDALKEIQTTYESSHKSVKLNFNFGGSGALQQQIEQGAPADLFISAAAKYMKELVAKQLIDSNKQQVWLTNELVAVVPKDGKTTISNVAELTKTDVKHVAIGIPDSVPAGSYAKEALTNAKLWDSLQSKLVQAKDVRQVLQYVETGNADAGFVYRTDALTSQKIKVAFAVDPHSYTAVEYPIGIVKATGHQQQAQAFYDYLLSKQAIDILIKYGFSVPK
jgi:molybdate transport system substrate-binding protein